MHIIMYEHVCKNYVATCIIDVCKCVSNSEDLQQSSTVDICIGTSVNPCICNDTGCRVSCSYVVMLTMTSHNSVMEKDMLEMVHCVQEIVTVMASQMWN